MSQALQTADVPEGKSLRNQLLHLSVLHTGFRKFTTDERKAQQELRPEYCGHSSIF